MPKCVLQWSYPKTNVKLILLSMVDNLSSMQSQKVQMKTTVSNSPVPASLYCFCFPLPARTVEVKQVEEMVTFKKALCPARLKSCKPSGICYKNRSLRNPGKAKHVVRPTVQMADNAKEVRETSGSVWRSYKN